MKESYMYTWDWWAHIVKELNYYNIRIYYNIIITKKMLVEHLHIIWKKNVKSILVINNFHFT